ncbi:MAG: type III-A CRISPR-associated protein Cas10/Csm1, partial [Fimbriimonadales bacterium]|nr:type III-A CRISPR-associated protein Cas10/Csm1 [Fimbriimonadales bacterium]
MQGAKERDECLWLAALLHDIGKFRQRAQWGTSYVSHQEHGAQWCEAQSYFAEFGSDLAELVRQHHNRHFQRDNETLLRRHRILQLADYLAAGERAQEARSQTAPPDTPLVSVFSRVPLGWKAGDAAVLPQPEQGYAPAELDWQSEQLIPTPEPKASQEAYARLWNAFEHEWQQFTQSRAKYEPADFRTLVALLEKYTSFIPSATPWEAGEERTAPDVSLYDHLRVTAAIAACLDRQLLPDELEQAWRTPEAYPSPLLALVKGDLSGIQAFLYLTGRGGAARGLKGRSFFLQLLTEAIAHFLLTRLELPIVCQLLASGGHFYLLVPYNALDELRHLHTEISRKLFLAFRGDLRVLIGAVPLSANDFLGGNFARKWGELAQILSQRKRQVGAELPDELFEQLFAPVQHATDAESLCQVCYGLWDTARGGKVDDGVRKCRRCISFEELGRQMRLPKALEIHFVTPDEPSHRGDWDWRETLQAFGYKVRVVSQRETPPLEGEKGVHIAFTNAFLPHRPKTGWSFEFRPLASATPPESPTTGALPSYEEIAENATGALWLGVLRMDVDSLGLLFARGLGVQATISRMATLSRMMRYFFEGYVAQLCQRYADESKLYLIYAGGDDLFAVGAWDVLPELAREIRNAFRQLIGADHITLSGGIAISHAHAPLYQLAETARVALDDFAKAHQWRASDTEREKDALCFLQTPMGWGEFEEVYTHLQQVLQMVQGDGQRPRVPRSLITRLGAIAAAYRRNGAHIREQIRTGKISQARERDLTVYARWLWRSVYHLSRFAEQQKAWREEIQQLRDLLTGNPDGLIRHLHVVARWAELYTRGNRR